jgi:hypothetical protein
MGRVWNALALAGLTLGMTAAVMIPAGAASQATARCDEGHWPATVQAEPRSFVAGGRAGFYVWHDSSGWHVRTTTPQRSPHPFTGTIVSSSDIKVVRQVRDEGRDSVTVNGNKLSFAFVTYKGVDGVDFKVGCTETVSFVLKAYNRTVPPTRIWLGAAGTAPADPFTVHRAG